MPPGDAAVHCKNCTAHRAQGVRQCIAGVPRPTARKQWGCALQVSHCPLSTAHCPQAVRRCVAGVPLPTAPPSVGQSVAGIPLPTAPTQCGSALQEFWCPEPLGSEAGRCCSSTAHCPPGQ